MSRIILALFTLLLTGCASTREPGTLPEPTTLSEVNRALDGEAAVVCYRGGACESARLQIGPEWTSITPDTGGVKWGRHTRSASLEVLTDSILHVTVDDSIPSHRGAIRGLGIGAAPGLVIAGIGLAQSDGENWNAFALTVTGGLCAVVGGTVGVVSGGVVASRKYPVAVYRAPVTRYPDAALALLEREAETASPVASR